MKNGVPILLIIFISAACTGKGDRRTGERGAPDEIVHKVVAHYFKQHNDFSTGKDVWGTYSLDLTFEAMLFYDLHTRSNIYTPKVMDIMNLRNLEPGDTVSYRSQPFCSYHYALCMATGNREYANPYVSETLRMMKEVKRTPEGAIQILHKDKNYVLIDYIQEYCSRVARTGALTGDSLYFMACADQFEIYRKLLRDPGTGLYSQGRGWLPDTTKISPGAWSRGHGWLIRGMVTALEVMPAGSVSYLKLQPILEELAEALLLVQDEDGMWHQLLHLPFSNSYPETSGTGMIAYNLAVAYERGFLREDKYRDDALLAAGELRKYVTDKGVVLGACEGPGPLRSMEKYLDTPAEPDDGHGAQAIIYGMLAEIILNDPVQTKR